MTPTRTGPSPHPSPPPSPKAKAEQYARLNTAIEEKAADVKTLNDKLKVGSMGERGAVLAKRWSVCTALRAWSACTGCQGSVQLHFRASFFTHTTHTHTPPHRVHRKCASARRRRRPRRPY